MGSIRQIEILKAFFKEFKTDNNFIFVDPVMGDNGRLYSGFDEKFALEMKELCKNADIVVPNITEACYMLQRRYKEEYTEKEIKDLLIELSNLGPKCSILTGVSLEKNEIGVMAYNRETNKYFSYFREKIPVKYHGTGDIFSSTLVGALVNNNSLGCLKSSITCASPNKKPHNNINTHLLLINFLNIPLNINSSLRGA